jgi:hypothetical protein
MLKPTATNQCLVPPGPWTAIININVLLIQGATDTAARSKAMTVSVQAAPSWSDAQMGIVVAGALRWVDPSLGNPHFVSFGRRSVEKNYTFSGSP